jgi:hypothetical protein
MFLLAKQLLVSRSDVRADGVLGNTPDVGSPGDSVGFDFSEGVLRGGAFIFIYYFFAMTAGLVLALDLFVK